MTSYLVTGATGFIGRRLVQRLLDREDAEILALVRAPSQQRFDEISRSWPGGARVTPVIGDITSAGVGLSDGIRERLSGIDHVIHLAALYDITARPAINETTNITGTRNVVELAIELEARCFHHVSSVTVAGNHGGPFTEARGIGAFAHFALEVAVLRGQDAYGELRKNLGRVILLGLEVLIIADIIRTIVVDSTVENVAVLGTIVLIRVVLSFSLEVEIDGMWPWNQWRVAHKPPSES